MPYVPMPTSIAALWRSQKRLRGEEGWNWIRVALVNDRLGEMMAGFGYAAPKGSLEKNMERTEYLRRA